METIDAIEEIIDSIEEYNDKIFDLENSIEEAKIVLEDEMNRHKLSKCHFDENKWWLEFPHEAKRKSIDFNKIKDILQFNKRINSMEFIKIVKCWTASLIESGYSPTTIVGMLTEGFREFLIVTKGLTEENTDELADELVKLSVKKRMLICKSLLNFFDYYTDFEYEEYMSVLYLLKPAYKTKTRIIPPSKDILIFSKVLDNYFSKVSTLEYRKWFPIWLWWKLTTLIPLRPSEFCNIERDCLLQKGDRFYIKLPRQKQKQNNNGHIQIIDEISIPENLYRQIEEYKNKTNDFGKSNTLISYVSIPIFNKISNTNRHKLDPERYSITNLRYALNLFYEQIVFDKYNVTRSKNEQDIDKLSIRQKLRPGDTRHIAFINLNRQGYHPVEIARIGGHTRIHSQNHYFNHISNLVDLEILELITNIDLGSYKSKIADSESKYVQTISSSFIEKYILRPSNTNFKRAMSDGYCTDPLQNCMVEDCWECHSWRITEEEFLEKKAILLQKLKNSQSEIDEVIENLKNIYRGIYENIGRDDFYSSENLDINKKLATKSKLVDNAIRKYINLVKVKERIDSIGNKGEKN
ncbi:site-specific integrase [Bacillus sp. CFBP 13597]|nr:site-specific integrase [Bacillus sp. CFBP 13597]